MENASKALMIAGGIFIALLVTSTLVFGWNKISSYQKEQDESQRVKQLTEFNKEFESYNKKLVRGYELVSLYNLTEDSNKKYSSDDGYKEVTVNVKFLKDTKAVTEIGNKRDQDKLVSSIDLGTYMTEYFMYNDNTQRRDYQKIFKESYFECIDTEYDGEKGAGTGSGRIIRLDFKQIKRNDET